MFAIMYIATGLGITVGFHRLFTHRSFKTGKAVRAILAALGSAAIEGPVISWVADHRKHHAYSDQPGDPHSPHVDHGHGAQGRAARPPARARRLAVHPHRARAEDALRAGPDRRPGRQLHQPHVRAVGARPGSPCRSCSAGLIGGTLADGPDRPAVGRRRADARPAPRDLQHQLAVPLLRPPALQDRRRVAQPRGGCRSSRSARRGTTTITRFPTSARHGLSRMALRPLRVGDLGAGEDRPGVGRRAHRPRTPGRQTRDVSARGAPRRAGARPCRTAPSRSRSGTARRCRRPTAAAAPRSASPRPRRSATCCARPAQLGVGRAYVSGGIDVDDIDAALALIAHVVAAADRQRARRLDIALARGQGGRAAARARRCRRWSCARRARATRSCATSARSRTTTTSPTSTSRCSSTSR